MPHALLPLLALLLAAGGPAPATAPDAAQDAAPAPMTRSVAEFAGRADNDPIERYLLYLPAGYDTDEQKNWPVLLFLHGAGERGEGGDAIDRVVKWGPPRIIEQGTPFEAIVVAPQCLPRRNWDPAATARLLDEIEANHRVDTDRIYVTGLSMGGYGTWAIAAAEPERIAAIVPVCGGLSKDGGVKIGNAKLPVWAFHGDKDNAVPLERSREVMAGIESTGHANAKLTVYPGVGHNSWSKAYSDAEMWEWLFAQSLADRQADE